jgi:hypothetical protein
LPHSAINPKRKITEFLADDTENSYPYAEQIDICNNTKNRPPMRITINKKFAQKRTDFAPVPQAWPSPPVEAGRMFDKRCCVPCAARRAATISPQPDG